MIENECDYRSQFQLPVYIAFFQYKGQSDIPQWSFLELEHKPRARQLLRQATVCLCVCGGSAVPLSGVLGPHETQCGLGRGLPPYQVAS